MWTRSRRVCNDWHSGDQRALAQSVAGPATVEGLSPRFSLGVSEMTSELYSTGIGCRLPAHVPSMLRCPRVQHREPRRHRRECFGPVSVVTVTVTPEQLRPPIVCTPS